MTDAELIGMVLDGKYRIERLLGRGGMGAVFAAEQVQLGRQVAVKVLRPELTADKSAVTRFNREARAAALIVHPNAVHVYDFGSIEGTGAYLVMELVDGVSLRTMMRRTPFLPFDLIATVMLQTSAALAAAHSHGVVHRDVKPENVIVRVDTEGNLVVKVVDFGLAKLLEHDGATQLTGPAELLGTPKYMAPEQFSDRPVDQRVDVYALGVMLYEMLAGRPPFEGTFSEIVGKHLYAKPPSFEELGAQVPEELSAVVDRAIAKDPDERIPTAVDFANDLRRSIDPSSVLYTTPLSSIHPAFDPSRSGTSQVPVHSATSVLEDDPSDPESYETRRGDLDELTRIRAPMGSSERTGSGALAAGPKPPHRSRVVVPTGTEPVEHPERRSRRGVWLAVAAITVLALAAVLAVAVWSWQSTPRAAVVTTPAPPDAATESVEPSEPVVKIPTKKQEPIPLAVWPNLRPVFRNGKIVFAAYESGIQPGAVVQLSGMSAGESESLPLVLSPSKETWVVKRGANSTPSGRTIDDLVPPGAVVEVVVRNPDSSESTPILVNRSAEP